MLLNPCIDCDSRTMACHTKCEEYREYKRKREELRKKRFEESRLQDYFFQAKRKHKN